MQRATSRGWHWFAVFVACVLVVSADSLRQGKDVNWDLQNYHFYNAFALLDGRLWHDVAPAMRQTYHNPLPELPFFWMVQAGWPTLAIQVAMALPAAIGAFITLRIFAVLFPPGMEDRRWFLVSAAAIAFMGAAGRAVIASTMNEWYCIVLVLAAIAVLVSGADGKPVVARLAAAGFLAGAAVGLKLTYGPHAVGLGVAAMAFVPWRESMRRGLILALFGVAGCLATYGFWGAILLREFGNPFFPYFNGIFQSPWWDPVSIGDERYGPKGVLDAIAYPIRFIVDGRLADDARFRDPRVALLLLLAVACAAKLRFRKSTTKPGVGAEWRFIAVFAGAAYVCWLVAFGIYRYLIPVEIMSGALIVACMMYLFDRPIARRRACAIVALIVIAATMKQNWGRIPAGSRYFEGDVPPMRADAVVVLEPQQPLAHVIPFFPRDARFVSPASNLLGPAQANGLARRIAGLLAGHRGPIYAIGHADSRAVDGLLAFYGLRREISACREFASPLDHKLLQLCPVARGAA